MGSIHESRRMTTSARADRYRGRAGPDRVSLPQVRVLRAPHTNVAAEAAE